MENHAQVHNLTECLLAATTERSLVICLMLFQTLTNVPVGLMDVIKLALTHLEATRAAAEAGTPWTEMELLAMVHTFTPSSAT